MVMRANVTFADGETVTLTADSVAELAANLATYGDDDCQATVRDEAGWIRGWIKGDGNYTAK